jgi:diacylglycerol kinase family enzyme
VRPAPPTVPFSPGASREPEHIASILLNTGAGGGRAGQPAVQRQMREAFARQGWATELTCIPAQRYAGEAPLRVRDARGVVVAAGGDGSANIVANACRAHGRPMGLLPLGSANLAARALGLEPGVEQAVAAITCGRPEAVRFAELNGRLFLTRALFGLCPALLDARWPGGGSTGWRERLSALASGLRTLAGSNATFEAVLDTDDPKVWQRLRGTTMQVSLNILPPGLDDPSITACIERGQLLLTGLAAHARWPTLGALLGSTFGSLEPARGGIASCASRIVVHGGRIQVPVLMDGDLRVMEPPLEFRVRTRGLRMMRLPRAATPVVEVPQGN